MKVSINTILIISSLINFSFAFSALLSWPRDLSVLLASRIGEEPP